MNTMERAARRVATVAGPAEQTLQRRTYRNRSHRSTANPLEQAADVLLLLLVSTLSATTRAGFTALLERRLRRAYLGMTR
jgi:type VI protein secretion system component VasF